MTKVANFTLSATILGYEIKETFHLPPSVFQHLLCDNCNSIMDSTSQVVNIPHLGIVHNVLTNPQKKIKRRKVWCFCMPRI